MQLTDCWYSQLFRTSTPSAGGGGKGSPSSPGKEKRVELIGYFSCTYLVILSTNLKTSVFFQDLVESNEAPCTNIFIYYFFN